MSPSTFAALLRICQSRQQLQQAHAQAIVAGSLLPASQPLACQLLSAYARVDCPADAQLVFLHHIPDPDVVSLTALISLHLQANSPRRALSAFSSLIVSAGLKPDRFAVVGGLSACGRSGDLACGKTVHGMIYRLEIGFDAYVGNAVVDMYCRNGKIRIARLVFDGMVVKDVVSWTTLLHGYVKCGDVESAYRVFGEMPDRNVIAWTAMITGFVQAEEPIRALQLFCWMQQVGEAPTVVTITGVLSGCADIGALDLGRSIHGCIFKYGMGMNIAILNSLIDMYSKSGSIETAEKIFDGMHRKDVYTWTTMMSCFAVHGHGFRVVWEFSEMLKSGEEPNEITFLALLSACSHGGLVDEGRKWFNIMRKVYNLEARIKHYGCMVDLLGRAGHLKEAVELIAEMQMEPDGIILRSLMSACLVHGDVELALKTGSQIIQQEPDDDGVYLLMWNIFASTNRWQEALEVRNRMKDHRIKKKPGCSWIEVNGVVHEFLAENWNHYHSEEIYFLLEGISEQLDPHSSYS